VDSELICQLVDRGSGSVAGDKLVDVGRSQPSMNLLLGLNFGS
jgi:hypothetical protein